MFNKIDAHSVEMYNGEVRSGKTLCMTADTHEDLKRTQLKVTIFTNYHLKDEFFEGLNITRKDVIEIQKEDIVEYHKFKAEFKNSIFLIDEFQQWLDNREFMKTGNKAISYFMGQMGKRGNVLRGTIHDYYLIDIRGRLYTQSLTYVFKGLTNDKGKWFQIENVNRPLNDEENEVLYIQKQTYIKKLIKTNFLPEFRYKKLKPEYVKAKDYYDMYDTEELITTDYDEDKENGIKN